jgi:hypothetical protein
MTRHQTRKRRSALSAGSKPDVRSELFGVHRSGQAFVIALAIAIGATR